MDGQIERTAVWLSQYVSYASGTVPADKVAIEDGIALLLNEKVMTVEEMRLEALREYSVIIPWNWFPKEK